ncbi:hypothetical protein A0H81_13740 [Grifola frondosa]|uniref:Uncharacterized protein n=1 Tax=Grifola frondosa TaxID=5627 RepID=A0A1C7LNL8_GRIFR|nr:hypothetical protein A0H81_13740 [Grifola frondosa]
MLQLITDIILHPTQRGAVWWQSGHQVICKSSFFVSRAENFWYRELLPPPDSNYLRQPSSSPIMHRATIASGSGTPFKAPAHKHAHHLHSIPPREKSTRTLIIDHLLWVHARTRFAQARAELGMTDRTGGPSSANFAHRERPENYEEDEESYSDGEDVIMLTARAGGPGHTHGDAEDERLEMQDLSLSRSLRQRAESVEKVATSMLDQPPEVPPLHPDDLLDVPTSPQLQPQNVRPNPHTLPNGVRLRLALATVINDLFSRCAPSPPSRSHVAVPLPTSSGPTALLPPALVPLAAISCATLTPGAPQSSRRPIPTQYIRSLYAIGTDPDTQNSPPSLRCPRHLHMGCEICVEAKRQAPVRTTTSRGRSFQSRAASTSGSSPGDGAPGANNFGGNGLVGGVTGWQDGSGIGSGLARPGPKGTVLRRPSTARVQQLPGQGGDTAQMNNTKLSELIVRFMRLSALVAMELGREATEDRASVDGGERRDDDHAGGSSNSTAPNSSPSMPRPSMMSPQTSPRTFTQRHQMDLGLYYHSLRPSREWYFLLAGLLTRAVFEGYMTGGWRGVEPLEVLLGVGLGLSHMSQQQNTNGGTSRAQGSRPGQASAQDQNKRDEDDLEFKSFDPDDLPDLDEAARVLFPSLRDGAGSANAPNYNPREGAELEYEIEMTERLNRFYDVPASTPDVATHMEDLAWQFPAEAVERAAVRFCEAVARWRGKPELETYKKASWIVGNKEQRSSVSGTAMSIESLVHSNPTSPSNNMSTPVADSQHGCDAGTQATTLGSRSRRRWPEDAWPGIRLSAYSVDGTFWIAVYLYWEVVEYNQCYCCPACVLYYSSSKNYAYPTPARMRDDRSNRTSARWTCVPANLRCTIIPSAGRSCASLYAYVWTLLTCPCSPSAVVHLTAHTVSVTSVISYPLFAEGKSHDDNIITVNDWLVDDAAMRATYRTNGGGYMEERIRRILSIAFCAKFTPFLQGERANIVFGRISRQ